MIIFILDAKYELFLPDTDMLFKGNLKRASTDNIIPPKLGVGGSVVVDLISRIGGNDLFFNNSYVILLYKCFSTVRASCNRNGEFRLCRKGTTPKTRFVQ